MGKKRIGRPDTDEDLELYNQLILEEIHKEYGSGNPLEGKVIRAYFASRSHGRGKRPKRFWNEVELLGVPGSNGQTKFRTVKEQPFKGLDSLAEELIPPELVPPNTTHYQYFLDWFRKLPSRKGNKRKKTKTP